MRKARRKVDKWPQSESELAKVVIAWLEDMQWDVYQEVQVDTYGRTADIVAVQNGLVWVIECKVGMNLAVLEQAYWWRMYANYTSIAVANKNTRTNSHQFGAKLCHKFGMGCLSVREPSVIAGIGLSGVTEIEQPFLNRKANANELRAVLRPQHKTFAAAGSNTGKKWTPFQETCENIREAVCKQPGITMKELLDKVKTHYSSTSTARSCIKRWAEKGIIKGVKLHKNGRNIQLFPV